MASQQGMSRINLPDMIEEFVFKIVGGRLSAVLQSESGPILWHRAASAFDFGYKPSFAH
jgi:hypothetical protein